MSWGSTCNQWNVMSQSLQTKMRLFSVLVLRDQKIHKSPWKLGLEIIIQGFAVTGSSGIKRFGLIKVITDVNFLCYTAQGHISKGCERTKKNKKYAHAQVQPCVAPPQHSWHPSCCPRQRPQWPWLHDFWLVVHTEHLGDFEPHHSTSCRYGRFWRYRIPSYIL